MNAQASSSLYRARFGHVYFEVRLMAGEGGTLVIVVLLGNNIRLGVN